MTASDDVRYVSRGGYKLAHAIDSFGIDPTGWVCADLGCNAGGFVDCLLRRGASRVYAVDTGYGALDYGLRRDPRVVVMERTNALHVVLDERVRLVTIDVAWTRQRLIVPRAVDMLDEDGVIVSLIKPHYEADRSLLRSGVLPDEIVETTVGDVVARLEELGLSAESLVESPIRGDRGNREWLALLRPVRRGDARV